MSAVNLPPVLNFQNDNRVLFDIQIKENSIIANPPAILRVSRLGKSDGRVQRLFGLEQSLELLMYPFGDLSV